MNNTKPARDKEVTEMLLLHVTSPLSDAIFRTLVGFGALALFARLWPQEDWSLVPYLFGVLFMMRLVPAIVRRLLPIPETVESVWARQRQLAKRYDSFQWRKLFWIGLGLACYTVLYGQFSTIRIIISTFCLLFGCLGILRWRSVASKMEATSLSAKQTRVSA